MMMKHPEFGQPTRNSIVYDDPTEQTHADGLDHVRSFDTVILRNEHSAIVFSWVSVFAIFVQKACPPGIEGDNRNPRKLVISVAISVFKRSINRMGRNYSFGLLLSMGLYTFTGYFLFLAGYLRLVIRLRILKFQCWFFFSITPSWCKLQYWTPSKSLIFRRQVNVPESDTFSTSWSPQGFRPPQPSRAVGSPKDEEVHQPKEG